MKKKIAIALALILVCFFALSTGVFPEGEHAPLYLALGDSISTGYGLADAGQESFAALTADALGYRLQNEAKDGCTAGALLERLHSGQLDAVLKEASLITLTVGGNDLMHALYAAIAKEYNDENGTELGNWDVESAMMGSHPTLDVGTFLDTALLVLGGFAETPAFADALAVYRENMFGENGVLSYIKAQNRHAKILICTQYNPYSHFGIVMSGVRRSMDQGAVALNAVICENASAWFYRVCDVYTAFEKEGGRLTNASDSVILGFDLDFHPNAKGHKLIAGAVMRSCNEDLLGFAGWQTGQNGLRLVGYVNSPEFDRVDLLVSVTGDGNERFSHPTSRVFRSLRRRNNALAVTCDETQKNAPVILPYGYLYGYGIVQMPKGSYTVTVLPTAYCGQLVFHSTEAVLSVTVKEDGEVTVTPMSNNFR